MVTSGRVVKRVHRSPFHVFTLQWIRLRASTMRFDTPLFRYLREPITKDNLLGTMGTINTTMAKIWIAQTRTQATREQVQKIASLQHGWTQYRKPDWTTPVVYLICFINYKYYIGQTEMSPTQKYVTQLSMLVHVANHAKLHRTWQALGPRIAIPIPLVPTRIAAPNRVLREAHEGYFMKLWTSSTNG